MKAKNKNAFFTDLKKNQLKWLMLVPSALVILVMSYIPMVGIIIAFKEYNYVDGMFRSPWVGFENFEYFIQSGKAWTITRNTLLYNVAFMLINNVFQIACAIMLSEMRHKAFKRVTQSVMFLPYFISWVVVGAIVYNLFNYEFGSVNGVLESLGLEPFNAYATPWIWIVVLIAVSLFKNLGYGTVMYLAAVMNIDSQLYEAADIDGATMWQKIWHVTLPGIRPTIVVLFLLNIGRALKGDFQMFWQVVGNNPMVLDTTDVIDTYVTRSLMYLQEFGMTSAAGLYQSVFSFALIMIVNHVVKKIEPEYALF